MTKKVPLTPAPARVSRIDATPASDAPQSKVSATTRREVGSAVQSVPNRSAGTDGLAVGAGLGSDVGPGTEVGVTVAVGVGVAGEPL